MLYAYNIWVNGLFLIFFIAIAREASPSGLYERRRTYPGAGRSHLKRTAQAAPSGKPTGAALGLVARDSGSGSLEFIYAVYSGHVVMSISAAIGTLGHLFAEHGDMHSSVPKPQTRVRFPCNEHAAECYFECACF